MRFTVALGLILALLAVLFAVQNPLQVSVRFLSWSFTGAFPLLLLLAFAAGFLCSLFLSILPALRRRRRIAALERRAADLEADLAHHKRLLDDLSAPLPAPGPAPRPPTL